MASLTRMVRAQGATSLAAAGAALLLTISAAPSSADESSDLDLGPFAVDDTNPLASIPSPKEALEHPLEMGYLMITLTERAEAAIAKNDHAKAALYYLAIAKATPDRALGYRKACESFEAAGDWAQAMGACRSALGGGGLGQADFFRFVQLALSKKTTLTTAEVADLDAVLAEMDAKLGKSEQGAHAITSLRCQLAVRLEDAGRLTTCAQQVSTWPAKDTERFVFTSLAAVHKGDIGTAKQLVASAEQSGVDVQVVARMKATLAKREASAGASTGGQSWRSWWVAVPLIVVAALAALLRKRRRLVPRPA